MPAWKCWHCMAKKPPKAFTPLDPGALPWLLASAIATTAPHASHLPLWLSLLVGAILLWRIGLGYAKAALPARTLLVLIVVGGTAGIGWEFHTLFGRDSLWAARLHCAPPAPTVAG